MHVTSLCKNIVLSETSEMQKIHNSLYMTFPEEVNLQRQEAHLWLPGDGEWGLAADEHWGVRWSDGSVLKLNFR